MLLARTLPDKSQWIPILRSENFDTTKIYKIPVSLHYRGNPLLTFGQTTLSLDSNLSFRYDPNGMYSEDYACIVDYLSLDDYLSIEQETGSLSGILFFSADKRKRIFHLGATWIFDTDTTKEVRKEALQAFVSRFFPTLKSEVDFETQRKLILENAEFTEIYEFAFPDTSVSSFQKWRFYYKGRLK